MSIIIEPTKIKQTFYLLIPKNIAELVDMNDHTKLKLSMKKVGSKQILEYEISGK